MEPMLDHDASWTRTIPYKLSYNIREASAILGVTVVQVYGYIHRQIVPAMKIDGVTALAHREVVHLHVRRLRRLRRHGPRKPLFTITDSQEPNA